MISIFKSQKILPRGSISQHFSLSRFTLGRVVVVVTSGGVARFTMRRHSFCTTTFLVHYCRGPFNTALIWSAQCIGDLLALRTCKSAINFIKSCCEKKSTKPLGSVTEIVKIPGIYIIFKIVKLQFNSSF